MNEDLKRSFQQIVDAFGPDVINDKNLANIVADYFSFDRNPAVRNILKAIVSDGYTIKISQLKTLKGDPSIDLERYANEIEQSWGYGKDQVRYVLSCIASSIGIEYKIDKSENQKKPSNFPPSQKPVVKKPKTNNNPNVPVQKQLPHPTDSYKKKEELNRASKYVFIVLLLVFVCIGGYMFIHKMNYTEEKSTVTRLIDEKQISEGTVEHENIEYPKSDLLNEDLRIPTSPFGKLVSEIPNEGMYYIYYLLGLDEWNFPKEFNCFVSGNNVQLWDKEMENIMVEYSYSGDNFELSVSSFRVFSRFVPDVKDESNRLYASFDGHFHHEDGPVVGEQIIDDGSLKHYSVKNGKVYLYKEEIIKTNTESVITNSKLYDANGKQTSRTLTEEKRGVGYTKTSYYDKDDVLTYYVIEEVVDSWTEEETMTIHKNIKTTTIWKEKSTYC